jgi:hypothetical protein
MGWGDTNVHISYTPNTEPCNGNGNVDEWTIEKEGKEKGAISSTKIIDSSTQCCYN